MDGYEIETYDDGLWLSDGDLFDTLEDAVDFAQMVHGDEGDAHDLRIVRYESDAVMETLYVSDLKG